MANVKLTGIKKSYGSTQVLHGIDLEINTGEFVVFVGPSGCGKSTLLRTIAGLERITGGTLEIDDVVVNDVPPSQRGIAMVFQSYALYPHMTVYDNMAFGLRLTSASADEVDQRVNNAASVLQLQDYLDRLPKELSGGQRQRVAIGRAICRDPKVFLFDEPLSNLDAALRVATRIEIAKLAESMPDTTMIYVTHDQIEAMTLADRIVVLRAGYVEQVGTPMTLYHTPANLFVAQFIGSPAMNILPGSIEALHSTEVRVSLDHGGAAGVPVSQEFESLDIDLTQPVCIGIRPEDFTVISDPATALLSGTVDIIEALGEVTLIHVTAPGMDNAIIAKLAGDISIETGSEIHLGAPVTKLHLFDVEGQSLLHSFRQ